MSEEHVESRPVRIGSINLGGVDYDVAVNGKAVLAQEGKDLYGRPAAHAVPLTGAAGGCGPGIHLGTLGDLAQELLNILAATMKERDAALARVHKEQ